MRTIERKFLINDMPFKIENFIGVSIEQGYLSVEPEVRIRKVGNKYFMSEKTYSEFETKENKIVITEGIYKALIENGLKSNLIQKERYTFPIGCLHLVGELDVYKNELEGLKIIKVKYASLKEAKEFIIPSWFGKEVTNDDLYKTQFLAFGNKNDYYSLILKQKKL